MQFSYEKNKFIQLIDDYIEKLESMDDNESYNYGHYSTLTLYYFNKIKNADGAKNSDYSCDYVHYFNKKWKILTKEPKKYDYYVNINDIVNEAYEQGVVIEDRNSYEGRKVKKFSEFEKTFHPIHVYISIFTMVFNNVDTKSVIIYPSFIKDIVLSKDGEIINYLRSLRDYVSKSITQYIHYDNNGVIHNTLKKASEKIISEYKKDNENI